MKLSAQLFGSATVRRWGVSRWQPAVVQERLLGFAWRPADDWHETVHRFRFGLWFWAWELHWWTDAAWKSIVAVGTLTKG